jgi:asparagine synthase (glutamine-hydrolysing)
VPGIVGIIGKGFRGSHEGDLKLMVDSMMHEPFYRQGSYVNEGLGVYAGWIGHPDSYADCLPATNEQKDVILLFAGEHFDDDASQQKRATELLRLYENEGDKFLRKLNGWFAGLLLDLRRSKVMLFNDRYGMHRIYYHEEKDAFLFSSEAKALLKIRPGLRSLDVQGMAELISCNCVLENRTLFSRVSVLPGGSAWTWEKGGERNTESYFRPSEWEELPPLDEETFLARLGATANRIVPRYFREKGRVGLSLTGGLDSRMIMACLDPKPGTLPCYTFGGAKDVLDISIARQVADVYGQTYRVIRLGENFASEFPRLAEKTIWTTDGNLDVGCTHDLYFNELARGIAPIRVTGKFGSEVIRDHSMFHAGGYEGALFCGDLKPHLSRALSTFSGVKKGHQLSVGVFKDFPWREYNKIILEQSQSVLRSPYMDNELVELMYRAPAGLRATNTPQRRIIHERNPKLSAIITDRGYVEGENLLLAKCLEAYYYALFKIDYTYLFAMPHWLTKIDTVCNSLVRGRRFLGSQKFEYYRIWFRDELSGYVKEILLDERTARRPYFDAKALRMMVDTHTKGTRNYMNEINRALSLELLCRAMIDQ